MARSHDNKTDKLTERKKTILRAIVDSHVKTGEPVGSKALTHYHGLNYYSSATIRNDMYELEQVGYLEQPHTSAGRIPSERGYRFYVDWLLERYQMTAREISELNAILSAKMSELDKILEYATKIVSEMTKYTGLAVKPPRDLVTVLRYEAICLDEYNLLLIIMFTEDDIRTMRVRSMIPITHECTTKLVSVLNTFAAGVSVGKITLPLIVAMEEQMGPWGALIDPIMKSVYNAMNEKNGGGVKIEGVNNLLQYPEYSDISAVKDLLSIFDREDEIVKLISEAEDDDNVTVYIGSENAFDTRGQSSLVFRKIRRGEELVAAIGIIGPRRMNYARVVTLIDRLTGGIANNIAGDISSGGNNGVKNSS